MTVAHVFVHFLVPHMGKNTADIKNLHVTLIKLTLNMTKYFIQKRKINELIYLQ